MQFNFLKTGVRIRGTTVAILAIFAWEIFLKNTIKCHDIMIAE